MHRRIVLIIMDGWGLRDSAEANAVRQANTPAVDRLWRDYPHTTLNASSEFVGLPAGQMGNSEVGHLNLGAGRVVFQDLMRISDAVDSGKFFENTVLLAALKAVTGGGRLHLMGLLSDGGVHSHQHHLYALLRMARELGVADVCIHAFLDGRDTLPTNGKRYIAELQSVIDDEGIGRIASVSGRYFAMDRDKRWERVRKGYDAVVSGIGCRTDDYSSALEASYEKGVSDEFVEPIVVVDGAGKPVGEVRDGDSIIFFNFRADRARQLTTALTEPNFDGFERGRHPNVLFTCMSGYGSQFDLPVAFPSPEMKNILAEVAANAGRRAFRIAETEKYAHVTYFFNGGNETAYPGEYRLLIPSPKVATYDMAPEMSAFAVTDALIQALSENRHDYVICNFANPDMVGHTGSLRAATRAVETVDECVGRVLGALDPSSDAVIITADHGNAEMMVDAQSGGPHTAHTTNPVPCILVDDRYNGKLIDGGSLRDIAPTICGYIGVPAPEEMTGRDLRASR